MKDNGYSLSSASGSHEEPLHRRVIVNDEITLGSVGVPAQPAVHPWSIREFGEEATHSIAQGFICIIGDVTRRCITVVALWRGDGAISPVVLNCDFVGVAESVACELEDVGSRSRWEDKHAGAQVDDHWR